AGADGAEYANLLGALEHGDIGDDAYHDARHHEGDGHEGYEDIADGVDYCGDGAHEQRHIVGVAYLLLLVGRGVVFVDYPRYLVLVGEGGGVEVYAVGA